jgi:carboxypeptidase Q
VKFRSSGAIRVANYGGIGMLIRSVTPFSIDSPHTGGTNYDSNIPKIPAAAITVEDSEMFYRMQSRGQ